MNDSMKDKILEVAKEKMFQFGYRRVTMDSIMQELKIAKKTIYKYFSAKERIAEALFTQLKEDIENGQEKIKKEFSNPVKVMTETVLFLQKELNPWFSPFMSDIEAELPRLWQDFVKFRTEQILGLEGLIRSAIKKGLFRSVNPAIAVKIYLGAIDQVIDAESLDRQGLSFSQAINEVMDIWSQGMLSENARPKTKSIKNAAKKI